MSTVFQLFFISYLVEPRYGKKFETFDDLLHFSVAYGYNDAMELAMSSTFCDEYQSFPYWRREDCNGIVACTRRIANNDQLRTVSVPRLSQYIASEMVFRDASKFLCTLDDNLLTNGFIFVLKNLNFYSHSSFWLRSTHTV